MTKKELGFAILIGFLSLFLSIILIITNDNQSKILLGLLPLIYGILFIGFARIHYYYNSPGMFLVNGISALRYLILPILIILYPNYTDSYGSVFVGSKLMLYEAVSIGIFLIFLTRKFYRKRSFERFIEVDKNNYFVLKIIVVLAIGIVIFNPTALLQYNFFFMPMSDVELIKGRWIITGIYGMILDWGKLIIPLLISIFFIRKYRLTKNSLYYYLTVLVVMFFNLMIFSGTSRNSAIMPATASMFFLLNVFPEKRRKIFLFFSGAIVLVVVRLTLLKVTYVGVDTLDSLGGIISYLEAYFLGPQNYGIAHTASKVYSDSFSISTLANDLFGNFPGLSHLFNLENRTNTFYNLIYQNGGAARDAIVPSIGQGLFYFGTIFSIIPQMLILYGVAIMDKFYWRANSLGSLYFAAYFAVRFGFTYIQNVSIILSFIYSMIIPISLFIFIDNRVKLRGRRHYEKNKNIICHK